MKKNTFTIGLDLGGTKLACALLNGNGEILEFIKIPINISSTKSPIKEQQRINDLMTDVVFDIKKRFPSETSSKNFKGIGLASAGPLNVDEGALINPVNFPGWKKVYLQKKLAESINKKKFATRVYFQNDAIAAALAEGWAGGAKGFKSYAVVTIGTGIGTGVIFNGLPCQSNGMGSEFGHLIIDFERVKKNSKELKRHTVEGIASGTGLIRRAQEMGFRGQSVEELVLEYKNGKKEYDLLFSNMAYSLACLCYNLSIGFNLEGIFLSGGLIKIKQFYLQDLKNHYSDIIKNFNSDFKTKIAIANTGNHAGVIGAGYLPYLKLEK